MNGQYFGKSPVITRGIPALVLAPMEGVTDAPMRVLMTERGGFDFCVSEFLRITQSQLPERTFLEHIPELITACRTPSGVSVQVQLLGGDESMVAQSAATACSLGAGGIDLNFGCPAKTVNRHDGGAAILRYPRRVRSIVAAVRAAVPSHIPVSAKLRLGWESMEDIFINAEQAALGGASWITIHARTRVQGYVPPAHWKYIGAVKKTLDLPIIANGEIWTLEDFRRCREETQCDHFMLGRGALGDPNLPHQIAYELGISTLKAQPISKDPGEWIPILTRYSEICAPVSQASRYTARRMKQWIKFAHLREPLWWFDRIKTLDTPEEILGTLQSDVWDGKSLLN